MTHHVIRSGVSACVLDALTDHEAAQALDMPIQTVRRVVRELCEHWQARNRVDLALKLASVAREVAG
jgi:DNA-binding NarL/FixJ family response regulator